MSEGHLVQFTLGLNNKVWVDETIESIRKPEPKIITNIYEMKDAIKFQSSLINFGYNHLPAFELSEQSEYIN